jgi:polysaccharide deacetylase family protein (PEP-CTERM system associated)
MKTVLLSMDIEDWYHLEYFQRNGPRHGSMLDGIDRFAAVLQEERVPATFFTVGELTQTLAPDLRQLAAAGHEIAAHGPDHGLLRGVDADDFEVRLRGHKYELEDAVGVPVTGYRAPCFSMERDKLDRLEGLGFRYDSSWIDFDQHPLYGRMDLSDWSVVRPGIHRSPSGGLVEFKVPTIRMLGRQWPVAGGAYFRLLPFAVTAGLVSRYLQNHDTYVFYIHPFECSAVPAPAYPPATSMTTRLRFQVGRSRTLGRVRALIRMMRQQGFSFSTFDAVAKRVQVRPMRQAT